ncbi:TfuA-related McrA-glycine thioamidation protein [Methanococcoides sp. AM1]|uniref:TfuA-related McrA-glycine thioamidation protein n=1 Tax=Methanococcoides sp. AM1 TaxID=1201011 RepID=UPI0010839167|nr:TfuA-related McrA-glycine thioamidation protein [Methanococcoides sp. AM1]
MRAVIFAGTSISHEDSREILDAVYLPPVARGDVDKVAGQGYDVIGIIDGVFFDRAAVAHKEIIRAMKKGIRVVGGCSMGALRASELDSHGMIGVGKVYGWYRDGIIEADDEVAVTTNPETFEQVSTPLVNIRETFREAVAKGIIDGETFEGLIRITKSIHYPQRSYLGVIKKAVDEGLLEDRDPLLEYCRNNASDVKREDAVLVLQTVKKIMETGE